MKHDLLSEVAYLVSPLDPFQAAESRIATEDHWVKQLTEDDVTILLGWLQQPAPESTVEPKHLQEVADRVAYYIGTAGKRLGMQKARTGLELLLHDSLLRISALEGLDAFGDRRAIAAIRSACQDRDPVFARQIAFVLGSLGGEEAVEILQGMLANWSEYPLVTKTIHSAIEEAQIE